jgi:hypothetical protein
MALGVFSILIFGCIGTSLLASSAWLVRDDGIGPLKIGMSLPELNSVLHETFSVPPDKEDQKCFYVEAAKHPNIAFMIQNNRLARVDVDGAGIPTVEGIQVGESESQARKIYGAKLKVEPHAYGGPEDHYLTTRRGLYAIRFETYGGKITRFYAGRSDAIQLIEGCQ